MRLLAKLLVGMVGAAAVPLAITGAVSTRLSERALRTRIHQDFLTLAASAAEDVRRSFHDLGRALAIYPELVDLERATPDVAIGVLRVAYRAHDDLVAITLLDDTGAPRLATVSLADATAAATLGRVAVSEAERDAFIARVPRQEALERGFAIGEPVLSGVVRCAIGVAVGAAGARRILAADVSLARIHERLGALSVGGTDVVLVDRGGRILAGGGGTRKTGAALVVPGARGGLPPGALVDTVEDAGGPALAAFAPVGDLGLGVVVVQRESLAMAAVADLRERLLYWLAVAALCALVVGVGLARDVARRARALSAGTAALAAGRFAKLDEAGSDELGDLARSFNHMADDLGRAQEEILSWSRELERRVEQKTTELRAAESLLLRARSLAAVGTLGAGVAHEINNPLCGLLGSAQLLLMDAREGQRDYPLLREIETQAQRIRAITGNLLRIARAERGDDLEPVDLRTVVEAVLERLDATLDSEEITVERSLEPVPPLRANRELLEEALAELVTNARRAMPDGGRLTLATETVEPRLVRLRVADTGRGMEREIIDRIFDPFYTTKTSWRAPGFGLTLVHKIVAEHNGTITVDSEVGRGSTFTLTFPSETAAARPHLA